MSLSITTAVTRASVSALNIVGRRMLTRHQQRKLAETAYPVLAPGEAGRELEELPPAARAGLDAFLRSAQFDYLALRLTSWALADRGEDQLAELRDQMRNSLRRHAGLGTESLPLITDVVFELLLKSIQTVTSGPMRTDSRYALAVAADAAAAMSRNTDLLQRMRSQVEVDEFSRLIRAQVRALHDRITLAHAGHALFAGHADLYVAPSFRIAGQVVTGFGDLLDANPRVVVLGDPGSGKSTLVSRLASGLAADPAHEYTVALVVVLREHLDVLSRRQSTLLECLESACRTPYEAPSPPGAIEYLLLNGRAVVFIDGLDELGEVAVRRRVGQMLEAFAHRFPLARIVVTARTIGYSDAPLDPRIFPCVGMERFSSEQVREYATRWFGLDTSTSVRRRGMATSDFLAASHGVDDLRRNPLILSLLCVLYSAKKYVPRNRPDVYEKCAELLFEQWDKMRGIQVPLRFEAHLRPALAHVAWWLVNHQESTSLPRPRMRKLLAEHLARKFSDEGEALAAADDFLSFCAGRAWVLTAVDSSGMEPVYGFAHRTFLEYFAAVQMVRLECTPEAVWQRIQARLTQSGWQVMNEIAVQVLDRNSNDGANRLLALALCAPEGQPLPTNASPGGSHRACTNAPPARIRTLRPRCAPTSSPDRPARSATFRPPGTSARSCSISCRRGESGIGSGDCSIRGLRRSLRTVPARCAQATDSAVGIRRQMSATCSSPHVIGALPCCLRPSGSRASIPLSSRRGGAAGPTADGGRPNRSAKSATVVRARRDTTLIPAAMQFFAEFRLPHAARVLVWGWLTGRFSYLEGGGQAGPILGLTPFAEAVRELYTFPVNIDLSRFWRRD